jgi:hypothetical protein
VRENKLVYVTQNQKNIEMWNLLPRLVLDVDRKTNFVGVYKPHCGLNQLWDFDGDGTIRSKTGKVLDVYEGRTTAETALIVYAKHGRWNQIFTKVPV